VAASPFHQEVTPHFLVVSARTKSTGSSFLPRVSFTSVACGLDFVLEIGKGFPKELARLSNADRAQMDHKFRWPRPILGWSLFPIRIRYPLVPLMG
jgi:hypothetical protein